MFDARRTPWDGLGSSVAGAVNSMDALRLSGLNWQVIQEDVFIKNDNYFTDVPGYKLNIRSSDRRVLGLVSDQYRVVQNHEAFAFTDHLVGGDVRYETAGSLSSGRRVWLLARMPDQNILGDVTQVFLVFSNTHDGTGAVKVAVTPVRVICMNTLNLALRTAQRSWSVRHTGDIAAKMHEAQRTLGLSERYLVSFGKEAESLANKTLYLAEVEDLIEQLLPIPEDAGPVKERNVIDLRTGLLSRYTEAPDLGKFKDTAWGFVNAVSDFATHIQPLRKTDTFRENLFMKTVDGHVLIDKAYELIAA